MTDPHADWLALERLLHGEVADADAQATHGRHDTIPDGVPGDHVDPDPELARQTVSLRAFRSKVAAALAEPTTAPPQLTRSVRELLDRDRADAGGTSVGTAPTARRRGWFDGPRRANAFAVAASLLLVSGAVLFGIFGPRIAPRYGAVRDTLMTEVAEWIAAEHWRCVDEADYGRLKGRWRTVELAEENLTRAVGVPVCVPDLAQAGFEFMGAGPCRVPGASYQSGHLIYRRRSSRGDDLLSVFVVPGTVPYMVVDQYGRMAPLVPGMDHTIQEAGGEMMYWTDGVRTWFAESLDPAVLLEVRPAIGCD